MSLLRIDRLRLAFRGRELLHGISLDIEKGETVALVGESGSGKSLIARVLLGLIEANRDVSLSGTISFDGKSLFERDPGERRGRTMSMIFQDPSSALNPSFTIGALFHEVLRRHDRHLGWAAAKARAVAMLNEVAIADPERVLISYSFQLSGGMNQRVLIAMALANEPKLLIADEPGTALDTNVQAQSLKLMRDVVERHGASVLLISHNLGVVREFADRTYVIYRGTIIESGRTDALFAQPAHAYTKALLAAVPRLVGGGIPKLDETATSFAATSLEHRVAEND